MINILYISHVSWGWIKQRPQFLAEELSSSCIVDVYYRKSNRKGTDLNPQFSKGNLSVKGFVNYPFERISFFPPNYSHQLNRLFWNFYNVDIEKYNYVWVTSPVLWWTIKHRMPRNKKIPIIYDCMDDILAFPYMKNHPKYRSWTEDLEKQLLLESDYVFCSADTLKTKLFQRYNINRDCVIVNNAITNDIACYSEEDDSITLPDNSLTYIGTVAEWFDFENSLRALDEFKDLNIVLYGPIRARDIPKHPRLHVRGPIAHDKILAVMNKSIGLFMPFVVNELIESVNPVKLYEYIYSGKPILASRYGETVKFNEYVSLYSNYEEFRSFINDIIVRSEANTVDTMRKYALNNTWSARCSQILEYLDRTN